MPTSGHDATMMDDSPLQWSVLLRLGRRYLGAHRTLTVLYVVGALLTMSILPVAVATTYGQLTNYFQVGQDRGAGAKNAGSTQTTAPASRDTTSTPSPRAEANSGAAPTRPRGNLVPTYAWWVALVLGSAALAFGHRYMSAYFTSEVERDIRADVFASVLRQSPRFFYEHSADELTMVVNQLTSQAQVALRQLLIDPIVDVVGLVVIGAALYQALSRLGAEKGPQIYALFAVIAVFMLVSPALVVRMGRRLQRQTSTMQRQNLAMATLVGGALAGPEEVQAMQAEGRFAQKFRALLVSGMRARLDQTMTIERLNTLNSLPGSLVLIALIGAAILLLGRDARSATPYTIVAVGLLTPQLMSVVQSLASFSINASMTWPAVEMVDAAMRTPTEVLVSPDARDIETVEPTVEAREVVFSYQPGKLPNTLNGVSFRIPPATIVGLVARSGGGKTSFFRLLLRFYDPQGGTVLLGGVPVESYTIESLRRHIALMTQESTFFHDSVRENFRVAAPDATDDEIHQMCMQTGLWPILERSFGASPLDAAFVAMQLSGGERKRFALTRILLRRPSLVLLDEPTVGIDPVDKLPLVDVIRNACTGRTVISVDHDLVWQTRLCDRFLVLDHGTIVEQGTTEELLARPGLFRDLYEASQNEQLRQSVAATAPASAMGAGGPISKKGAGPVVALRGSA